MHDDVLIPGIELLQSMRSVGYDFNAAVADLIDNSIAAKARRVDVFGDAVGAEYVAVVDDGVGMDEEGLRSALRLAGSASSDERHGEDLGRFGLGLKTASLSQARKVTVCSKEGSEIRALQWDIDYVKTTGTWTVRVLDASDIEQLPQIQVLRGHDSGTLIVWHALDLLLAGEFDCPKAMASHLHGLRGHLSLTFHRYLEGEGGRSFTIRVNGLALEPVDPFLRSNRATQASPPETVVIDGQPVQVVAYTLPHAENISAKEKKRRDLGDGMRDAQGFYVYRNRRLISHGNWAGMVRRQELAKQSRVQVDFPNSLDHLWKLDIKKSRADPPAALRRRLADILDGVVGQSKRLHTFRARKDPALDPVERLWSRQTGRNGYWYEVNLEHPEVRGFATSLDDDMRKQFERLIVDLAATFPVGDLYVAAAQNDMPVRQSLVEAEVAARLRELKATGYLSDDAGVVARLLKNAEPFDTVEGLEHLVRAIWEEPVHDH